MNSATCNTSEDSFVLSRSVACLTGPRLRLLQAAIAASVVNSVLRVSYAGLRAIILLTGIYFASIVLETEASAEPEFYKYGKHTLQLVEGDGADRLLLDGRTIIEDWSVTIEKRAIVGGVPVVFGDSNMGGAGCAPIMFLIAFPQGKRPEVHSEIGNCSSVWAEVKKTSVHFTTRELPGLPGMHVRWSPTRGLETLPNIVFRPDPKKNWSSVGVNPRPHVADLFDIPPVADVLYRLIRGDAKNLMWIVNGSSEPGRIRDGYYIGDSCQYHECPFSKVLIILDLKKKQAYLAWSDFTQEKIISRPSISTWKGVPREEFERWKIEKFEIWRSLYGD
jgi:hypothetical protein